jgi:hypothetical protein
MKNTIHSVCFCFCIMSCTLSFLFSSLSHVHAYFLFLSLSLSLSLAIEWREAQLECIRNGRALRVPEHVHSPLSCHNSGARCESSTAVPAHAFDVSLLDISGARVV